MATRKFKRNTIVIQVPSWAVNLYIACAVVLVPWTVYLGWTLPTKHLTNHWDVGWAGFNMLLIVAFFMTGILAYLRSMWVVMGASITGSLLLVDAWFDVMSEHGSHWFAQAVVTAIFIEIPLALTSFYLATHALKRVQNHHQKHR